MLKDKLLILLGGEVLDIKQVIEENISHIKEIRKKLNSNAELAFNELKTREIIINFLNELDFDTETVAKTGVVATLNPEESCIGVRADMDAIPVNGVSHACGHDYHMAVVLGVALTLKKMGVKKGVKFIFQPAEECVGGALPMINEGVLENPQVKYMVGFHVWPKVKVGTIEVAPGPSMASVDDLHISFIGEGGHAAMPHLCKNPIYPALDFIESMTIKSKIENNPLNPHVLTFSSIQCGAAPNIIAEECKVLGTVRTFDNDLRQKLYKDILKASYLAGEKYGCTTKVEYKFQYPAVVSDESITRSFINITKDAIGEDKVLPLERTFAAEDFSYFAEKVPAVHFRLGIAENDIGIHPLHSPDFNASDEAILNGIYIITNFIMSMEY